MKQNIEFERCIDFLVRMLDKYGEELLRELEEDKENNGQEKEENEKKIFEKQPGQIENSGCQGFSRKKAWYFLRGILFF